MKEFIQSFILPRWRCRLALGRISIETCQKLDRRMRKALCKILHIPANLLKESIHLSIRMGGLGIPKELVFGELRFLFSNENWRVLEGSIPARGALL